MSVERNGLNITVSWPAHLNSYDLWATDSLDPLNWQKVTSGIAQSGNALVHTVPLDPGMMSRFFQLRLKPDQSPNFAVVNQLASQGNKTPPKQALKKRRYRFLRDGSLELIR